MGIRAIYAVIKQRYDRLYRLFVDLLLSKHTHNGAAARRVLLVLGAPFDARRVRCASAFKLNGSRVVAAAPWGPDGGKEELKMVLTELVC